MRHRVETATRHLQVVSQKSMWLMWFSCDPDDADDAGDVGNDGDGDDVDDVDGMWLLRTLILNPTNQRWFPSWCPSCFAKHIKHHSLFLRISEISRARSVGLGCPTLLEPTNGRSLGRHSGCFGSWWRIAALMTSIDKLYGRHEKPPRFPNLQLPASSKTRSTSTNVKCFWFLALEDFPCLLAIVCHCVSRCAASEVATNIMSSTQGLLLL
jgi:hypothetical protein